MLQRHACHLRDVPRVNEELGVIEFVQLVHENLRLLLLLHSDEEVMVYMDRQLLHILHLAGRNLSANT